MSHPAAAVRERVGERRHPHQAAALGQPDEDLVVDQRDVVSPAQVVVEPVEQERVPHHQRAPGTLLVIVEPPGEIVPHGRESRTCRPERTLSAR